MVESGVPAPPCIAGLEARELQANGLTFSARLAGRGGSAGNVLLLHGFPETCEIYEQLMLELASQGFCSLAYNQRGYSRDAAPSAKADYHYDHLRDDVFAVAEAVGFGSFHLVGHDHGALLGWCVVGCDRGRERILSYTSLGIPHPDAFSRGLYGDEADVVQQMASQYFTLFVLDGSASLCGSLLYWILGRPKGFRSAASFQKALWWYNGAFDAGVLAMPPLLSASSLCLGGFRGMACMRCLFGGEPNEGREQLRPVGSISMPVLYICGSSDSTIYGTRPYALKTKDYCTGGYQFLEVAGGHDTLSKTCCSRDCFDKVLTELCRHLATRNA